MTTAPLRIGLVGANARRAWAHDAHVPALRRLPQFTLTAVSARSQALAEEARVAFGAARAYGDSLELVRAPDIDIVVITVKVPEHRAIALSALEAGKHLYCEWPLGRDLAEAQEMAAAVKPSQHAMIGLQGLSAPAVRHAAKLVRDGALGRLKVMRAFSPTVAWGPDALPHYAYLQDKRHGATLESIAGGHTLAALEAIAGPYVEVDARNTTLIKTIPIHGSSECVERTCADHMLVLGKHDSGCVSTLEVIGGSSTSFLLEVTGDHGSLKITGGRGGGYQVGALKLEASFDAGPAPLPLLPELGTAPAANVAEAYSRLGADIRSGRHTVPDFQLAVRLTRLLDRIDLASSSGMRQKLE